MGKPRSGSRVNRPSRRPACDQRRMRASRARQPAQILPSLEGRRMKMIHPLGRPARNTPSRGRRKRENCPSARPVVLPHLHDGHRRQFAMLDRSPQMAPMPRSGHDTPRAPANRRPLLKNPLPATRIVRRRLFAAPATVPRSMSPATMDVHPQRTQHMELHPHPRRLQRYLFLFRE